MRIDALINKYKIYKLEYRFIDKVIVVHRVMLINDFFKLKKDIDRYKLEVNDLIIEGE